MVRYFLILLLLAAGKSQGQTDTLQKIVAFRITDYTVKLNDSVTVVQVNMPDTYPFLIPNDQLAVLKPLFRNSVSYDTSLVGWGRCNLIKGNYYYFAIHHERNKKPQEGDLLYTTLKMPPVYDGLLLKTGCHAIEFTKVNEEPFYDGIEVFSMTKVRETAILDSMVKDIRNTGKIMLTQLPKNNMDIKGGIYRGRKLFAAMQQVRRAELEEFIKYILARPGRYAGNVWKISEIYATWMVSNTPTVKKGEIPY